MKPDYLIQRMRRNVFKSIKLWSTSLVSFGECLSARDIIHSNLADCNPRRGYVAASDRELQGCGICGHDLWKMASNEKRKI
ncbi:hypothetical protein PTKIN_Ptkin01aG0072700 [Pterospermum kingtungense]